jgi:hypothetical protein
MANNKNETPAITPQVVDVDTIETSDFGQRIALKSVLTSLKKGQGLILPAKRRGYIRRAYPDYTIKATADGGILVYKE